MWSCNALKNVLLWWKLCNISAVIFLIFVRLEMNAGLMTWVTWQLQRRTMQNIDDAAYNKNKCRAIDWLFPIELNAPYLDTKRVRTCKTDRPLRLVEALSTPTSRTRIAALTLLNTTLSCTTSYWQTGLDSGLFARASPAAALTAFDEATVLAEPLRNHWALSRLTGSKSTRLTWFHSCTVC